MRIGALVMEDLGVDSISLTEDGLRSVYEDQAPNFEGIETVEEALDYLSDDLSRIRDAVEVLDDVAGEDNDIQDSFFEFEQELDPDGDGVDIEDLQTYINRLKSES